MDLSYLLYCVLSTFRCTVAFPLVPSMLGDNQLSENRIIFIRDVFLREPFQTFFPSKIGPI